MHLRIFGSNDPRLKIEKQLQKGHYRYFGVHILIEILDANYLHI